MRKLQFTTLACVVGLALTTSYLSSAHGQVELEEGDVDKEQNPAPAPQEETAVEGDGTVQDSNEAKAEKETPSLDLTVGGAIRFNYFYKTWEGQNANRNKGGDFAFEMFRIGTDVTYGDLGVSAQYRFYSGYHMLHHGYVFYRFTDAFELQAGMTQAPFGILPYASHSWFFNLSYYVGLEDDYDIGMKALFKLGGLDIQAAFFKNDEWSFTGNSVDSSRYSYDVVSIDEQELAYAGVEEARDNQETNQFNLRLAYTFDHGKVGSTEIGASGRVGWLYNGTTEDSGEHWAVAGHFNGNYLGINLQLEAAYYDYNPANPSGQSRDFVVMGAFDAPYKVASRGLVLGANLAYTIDLNVWPLDSLTFFNDYSIVYKPDNDYEHSQGNIVGVILAAGPLVFDLDVGLGLNHPWIGPLYGTGLAEGSSDAEWETRVNFSMGFYF